MSASRDRKEASKRLGLELHKRYRELVEASSENEISQAAVVLGATFNQNIEFVIWILKEYGGLQQLPFERPNKALPKTPSTLLQ